MERTEPGHSWGAVARAVLWAFVTTTVFVLGARVIIFGMPESITALVSPSSHTGTAAAAVPSPFTYSFQTTGALEEAGSMEESTSPYWWLDSGGRLILRDGVGKTLHGALPALDEWRLKYRISSRGDTGDGFHPQNLFRLVSRSEWENVRSEAKFRITAGDSSDSANRNESNGLLLMSRYKDGDNLYYAGIRVDGNAVIKKKQDDSYSTLAEKKVFPGAYEKNTNLLPFNEWVSLRSETVSNNGIVTIRLYMKREGEIAWKLLLAATDDEPIQGRGFLGIRTDFMDVEFDDFRAEEI